MNIDPSTTYDIVIIGSGPAGCTAAIYSARDGNKTLVFEGNQPGGQLITTTLVENFPGFSHGIDGPELVDVMKAQAINCGSEFIQDEVIEIDTVNGPPYTVKTGSSGSVKTKAIIIATGATARYLGLSSESALVGRGVSGCATCDGFFFRGMEVAVVGGGDTAMEDAHYLTHHATKVTIIHRRDGFRASETMLKRAQENPKIAWRLNTVIDEVVGSPEVGVTGLKLRSVIDNSVEDFEVKGLFVAIGHDPQTGFAKGIVNMNAENYIETEPDTTRTYREGTSEIMPGIFAAGDCMDTRYKQAITAAGFGCMAALNAREYLHSLSS